MGHEIFKNKGDFCYVGKDATAWHGLEEQHENIVLALENNPYYMSDIVCEPYYLAGSNGEFIKSEKSRVVKRVYDGHELGCVGAGKENEKHWTPLQNKDLLKLAEPILNEKGINLEAAIQIKGGEIVALTMSINDAQSDITNGDSCRRRIILSNGHNGKVAARIGFSDIRIVCANTYNAAINSATSKLIRVNHSSEIYMNMEKIRDVMDIAKADFLASCEQLRVLASKKINAADLRRYVKVYMGVDPEKEVESTRGKNIMDRIITCVLDSPGKEYAPNSWYSAAHGINFYENHVVGKAENRLYNCLFLNKGEDAFKLAFDMAS